MELLVRVHLRRQRKVRVWDPGCRSLMIRPLQDQPDFMTQVRFERSFEVDSQGGKRARKRRTVETRRRPLPGNEILWRVYAHVALIAHFQQLARG